MSNLIFGISFQEVYRRIKTVESVFEVFLVMCEMLYVFEMVWERL